MINNKEMKKTKGNIFIVMKKNNCEVEILLIVFYSLGLEN